jgi:hypothetical protein
MAKHPARRKFQHGREILPGREQGDPPIRLAHVLFVLWVAGSVAWAFYGAALAHERGWWELDPIMAAILVLAPPILAHALANFAIKMTSNPKFRS